MAIIPSEQVVGPEEPRDCAVSRKPRASGGRKIHPYTFLSGKTFDEDLEEQLEEKNFKQRPEDPLEKPSVIQKLDNCRFVQQKSLSELWTSWRNPEIKQERLAVTNELKTIQEKTTARSGTSVRKLKMTPWMGKVRTQIRF